jgi:hypothetical protein
LQMFVMEACTHAEAEVQRTTTSAGQLPVNHPEAVNELLSGLVQSKQDPSRRYFAASTIWRSPLAPHLDLQLQLPSQQLLQLLIEAASSAPQQQQQQQEQQQQEDASSALPSGILAQLHPGCRQQLLQLFSPWQDATAAVAQVLQDSSGCDALIQQLLQDCTTLLAPSGGQQQAAAEAATEVDQAPCEPQQQQTPQQPDQGEVTAAPAGPEEPASRASGSNGSSSSSSGQATSVEPTSQDILKRVRMFASCLVLKFIEEALKTSGEGASSAQQLAVPLQVLVLCNQVQQLQGALQRCLSMPTESEEQQQQDNAEQQEQQQPQQAQQVQAGQPTHNKIAATTNQQHLTVVVGHAVNLLQSIRRFMDANDASAAIGTAHAAPAGCVGAAPGSTARGSSSSNGGSYHDSACQSGVVEPLAPASFFAADGPLASGFWGLREPVGAGIWAPVDSTAATPAATATAAAATAQPEQQQMHSQNCHNIVSNEGSQPLADAQSTVAAHQHMQQQAWQVLLGSCAWQHALQQVDERNADALQPTDAMLRQINFQLFRGVQNLSLGERDVAQVFVEQFKQHGLDSVNTFAARRACAVPHALLSILRAMRTKGLGDLGFDAQRLANRHVVREQRKNRRAAIADRMQRAGFGETLEGGTFAISYSDIEEARRKGVLQPWEDLADIDTLPHEEDEQDIMRREARAMEVRRGVVKELTDKITAISNELERLAVDAMEIDEQAASDALDGVQPAQQLGQGEVLATPGGNDAHCGTWGSDSSDTCSSSGSPNRASVAAASNASHGGHPAPSCLGPPSPDDGVVDGAGAGALRNAPGRWVLAEEVAKAEDALR